MQMNEIFVSEEFEEALQKELKRVEKEAISPSLNAWVMRICRARHCRTKSSDPKRSPAWHRKSSAMPVWRSTHREQWPNTATGASNRSPYWSKTMAAWTSDELRIMEREYPHLPALEIANQIGRTVSSVYSKANSLGLRKTEDFFADPERSGRLGRGHTRGCDTRFKPGGTPWNKGMRYRVITKSGVRGFE